MLEAPMILSIHDRDHLPRHSITAGQSTLQLRENLFQLQELELSILSNSAGNTITSGLGRTAIPFWSLFPSPFLVHSTRFLAVSQKQVKEKEGSCKTMQQGSDGMVNIL